MTAWKTFLEVHKIGGKLEAAGDGRLKTFLPPDCSPELKDSIREHKPVLLALLGLNFLVIRSETLKVLVYWTPDEATKSALVAAGASPGDVYTPAELKQLVCKRVTSEELVVLHMAKKRFNGRIA